jgi:DNA repair protein RadC
MRFQRAEPALEIANSKAAEEFFASCFGDCDAATENLFVAHLTDGSRCLKLSHYAGDASSLHFPVREIVADALILGSAGLILAHNHPSGDCRPSDADCRATRRLATVAEAMDCSVVDHLIFGGANCTSFRQLGLI